MSSQGILGAFGSHAFMSGLSEQHKMRLATGVRPFAATKGDYLGREGERAKDFFLIQFGRVEIGSSASGGRFVAVSEAGPGEVVGWSWLLPPHIWQFDCRAEEDVHGLVFDAEWLRELCESDHELGYHLLKHLLSVVAQRLAANRTLSTKVTQPA